LRPREFLLQPVGEQMGISAEIVTILQAVPASLAESNAELLI
jgi:hypothetical protein